MALSRCGAVELDTEERDNRRSERRLSKKKGNLQKQTGRQLRNTVLGSFPSKNTKESRLIFERPIEA